MSLRDKGNFFLDISSQMYNIGIGGFFILVLPLDPLIFAFAPKGEKEA